MDKIKATISDGWCGAFQSTKEYQQGKFDFKQSKGTKKEVKNPYKKGTDSWRNWNRGWNSQISSLKK